MRHLRQVDSGGPGHLQIENKGSRATEVEILFPDDRIVSEKENIGPGTKYTLTARSRPARTRSPAARA
ncbi:hypothetical protein E4K10_12340 [Streptomyces sp. T1317-0309]|nr:hypothetical protein E4K10_12340 [Streptomyces sp. T1317-0309]